VKDKIFRLTPLGRADILLKEFLGVDENFLDTEEFQNYEDALQKYRNLKLLQMVVKILLYAGLITSVAASLGLDGLRIINQVASYLGFTVLLVSYAVVNYATMIHREEYHVKREILVSHTEFKQETQEPGSETEE
jgi:hypothetical protein